MDAWVIVLVTSLSTTPLPAVPPGAATAVEAAVSAAVPTPPAAYRHGERHYLTASACEAAIEGRPVPAGHRLVCLPYGTGDDVVQAAAF